jgi:hypothetical protein
LEDRDRLCALSYCPGPAVYEVTGVVGQWQVVIPLCWEHARELREGTPLGALSIDKQRLEVRPLEEATPEPPPTGFGSIGPQ